MVCQLWHAIFCIYLNFLIVKQLLLLLLTMFGLSSCMNAQDNSKFVNTDVAGFAKLITNPDEQILDVRTPAEFAEGHIAGAVNIDIYDDNFMADALKTLDPSRPVAVYCRSGKRSADAASRLAAKGYRVTNLEGGILAWIEQKLPTVK